MMESSFRRSVDGDAVRDVILIEAGGREPVTDPLSERAIARDSESGREGSTETRVEKDAEGADTDTTMEESPSAASRRDSDMLDNAILEPDTSAETSTCITRPTHRHYTSQSHSISFTHARPSGELIFKPGSPDPWETSPSSPVQKYFFDHPLNNASSRTQVSQPRLSPIPHEGLGINMSESSWGGPTIVGTIRDKDSFLLKDPYAEGSSAGFLKLSTGATSSFVPKSA